MPTRPSQGGSAGTWGAELNAWEDVARNADGTLKTSAVQAALGGFLTAPLPSGDTTGATDAAVLNALMADGASILLGKALSTAPYWVNASLNYTTHCALVAFGQNLTNIKRAADVPIISQVGTNGTPLRNCRLIGVTIDGNTGAGYTSTLVQQSYVRDPVMRDVTIFGADGIGLDQLEVWDFQSDNLIVSSCGGNNVATNTTATGVNALNSTTVNVGSTTGFGTTGIFTLLGAHVAYTGKTSTSFTGCSNHPATTGGETVALSRPAHVMRCSDTDTVNNMHFRGYRNESYGADGSRITIAVGTNIPKNIVFVDQKVEKHASAGIIDNFQQVQGLYQIGGTMPITGGLATGVAQGVDLCSFPGCEDVHLNFTFSIGGFAASDVRSLFNWDGSVYAIDKVKNGVKLRQGTGSQPTYDDRITGTVNSWNEDGHLWNSAHSWTNAHLSASPTSHGGLAVKGRQVFTASGAGTYTPTPGTLAILVECVGGGGGGGNAATAAVSAAAGGGGGGGAYAASYIFNPGVAGITLSVGASGASASSGGDSSFNSGVVLAKGGGGGGAGVAGTAAAYTAGANGGLESSCVGDVKQRGGAGAAGVLASGTVAASGQGGNAAGDLGGGGGLAKIVAGVGTGGGTYGGGGSGGLVLNGSAAVNGGTGSVGVIVVTEYGN
jgi:hypothetical protein